MPPGNELGPCNLVRHDTSEDSHRLVTIPCLLPATLAGTRTSRCPITRACESSQLRVCSLGQNVCGLLLHFCDTFLLHLCEKLLVHLCETLLLLHCVQLLTAKSSATRPVPCTASEQDSLLHQHSPKGSQLGMTQETRCLHLKHTARTVRTLPT